MILRDKHERFCREYVVDLNATQAAIRSGYKPASARSTASHLLGKPAIKDFIKELQVHIGERLEITSEMILQELGRIAFSTLQDYVGPDAHIKDFKTIGRNQFKAVSGITVTETEGKGGRKVSTKLKLYDKVSALEKLGRHTGAFEVDPIKKIFGDIEVIYPGGEGEESL